ncbi:DUF7249 family protein [Pseudotabrizicola alkalilacus]|uniref:DUF7249 family protein n=1 Tax=Pseudotabrizicola alkalilacus TaxID=2305252 RepID=UPI00268EDDEE
MAPKTTANRPSNSPYNGHPNRNLWNVALHMANDYGFYHVCRDLLERHGLTGATEILYCELGETETPDGGRYTKTSIRHGLRCLSD